MTRATKLFTSNHSSKQSLFIPRTAKQEEYKRMLHNNDNNIVVAVGPAGTAKTFGATLVGLEKVERGEVDRLVITRPAVSADEDLGFLPGSLEKKMHVWLLPIFDSLKHVINQSRVDKMMQSGLIEICSLSHMRGRTFRNAFIIADECQNCTPSQMLMLLTRIGENSKMVCTGDPQQHDRNLSDNGLHDLILRLDAYKKQVEKKDEDMIQMIEFATQDIQRHPVIPHVLDMYDM